jgi:hypothetical protein
MPVMNTRESDKWAWKDRYHQWSRMIAPTELEHRQPEDPVSESRMALKWPLQVHGTSGSPNRDGWQPHHITTTATFGHILHQYDQYEALRSLDPLLRHDFPRLLSPVTPLLPRLRSLDTQDAPSSVTTTIVFRFLPSPLHKIDGNLKNLPPIELRLQVPDDVKTGPLPWKECKKEITIMRTTHHADILLPQNAVDVRITQKRVCDMSNEHLEQHLSRARFLNFADLNLKAGRLITPPFCRFDVTAPFDRPNNADDSKKSELGTKYMFFGLEIHRSVNMDYHGHSLCYTSIEAGQHGGRRAELTLKANDLPEGSSPESVEKMTIKYLQTVFDLAQGNVFAPTEQMGKLPSIKFSGDPLAAASSSLPVDTLPDKLDTAKDGTDHDGTEKTPNF